MEKTGIVKSYLRPEGKGIKLHLGCGDYWFEGYINIDHAVLGGTDMVWDLRTKLPFQDSVVEVVESYDFVEHFTRAEIDLMLEDWKRVLINKGKVIAVVPNILKILEMGDLQQIYGIEQDHKWGYTPEALHHLFTSHGFDCIDVIEKEVENRPGEPKLELTCIK